AEKSTNVRSVLGDEAGSAAEKKHERSFSVRGRGRLGRMQKARTFVQCSGTRQARPRQKSTNVRSVLGHQADSATTQDRPRWLGPCLEMLFQNFGLMTGSR